MRENNIEIKWIDNEILIIRIPRSERELFMNALIENLQEENVKFEMDIGTWKVIWILDNKFVVDIRKKINRITIYLKEDDLEDITTSLKEHLLENSIYELDHSLEAFGAEILPEDIKDVVIETIDGNDTK